MAEPSQVERIVSLMDAVRERTRGTTGVDQEIARLRGDDSELETLRRERDEARALLRDMARRASQFRRCYVEAASSLEAGRGESR